MTATVSRRGAGASTSWGWTLAVLVSRLVGFALVQAAVAGLYLVSGASEPWQRSLAWWPISATVTSLAGIALLDWRLRCEGSRYLDLLRVQRATVGRDLLVVAAAVVVAAVLAVVPNVGLSVLLWGDPEAGAARFFAPLPPWAAVLALVAFPLAVGLSELPTYFGYVLPRLRRLGLAGAWAVILSGSVLSLQHVTLPLAFDPAFLVWRAFMFLPFGLFLAALLAWRPRLLPYLVVVHVLLDLAAGVEVAMLSFGAQPTP